MLIKIIPNDSPATPGNLAEAERPFEPGQPPAGLKSVGWAIGERRVGGGRNVTHPARSYSANGERRSFSLVRPISDSAASDRIREQILDAYARHEQLQAEAAS